MKNLHTQINQPGLDTHDLVFTFLRSIAQSVRYGRMKDGTRRFGRPRTIEDYIVYGTKRPGPSGTTAQDKRRARKRRNRAAAKARGRA